MSTRLGALAAHGLDFPLGMMSLRPRYALVALAAAAATMPASAFAADGASAGNREVLPTVLWMSGGVAAFLLVLSVGYGLKRAIGAFPKNPTWIAPITIRPSSEFPGDLDPHEATSAHDDHAPQPSPGH